MFCSCQPKQLPVNSLAERVTEGTSKDRILFRMTPEKDDVSKDYFEITAEDGKVLIVGNSDLSLATGLNWYLKYVAGIHLSWNNLSQKLPEILPLPQEKIRKETSMQDRYYLKSNRESGFGRYDVMLEPKNPGKDNAVILEFKVRSTRKEKSLEETAQSAITQIRERKYSEELRMKGITEDQIKEYGFAFEGKTVLIVD